MFKEMAYNEVSKSPSLPEEYGVIARKFTPSGTFLGYYKDIAKGEEFLVSYGPDYWASLADNLPQKSRLMKLCKKLSDRQGYSLFSPLYSVEAPSLAA
eukprot:gene37003-45644_t